jgi:single-stranded-DNA-specific exonuclease
MTNQPSNHHPDHHIRGIRGVWKRRTESVGSDASNLTDRVLSVRGIGDVAAASRFLDPQLNHLHDPSMLPGLDAAAERMLEAIQNRERIAIYGDYDVDGISATAILYHMLHAVGAHVGRNIDVECYVPHRLEEGYGLNSEAMEELASRRVRLVVSVDCGVTAFEPALRAKQLGMDLVITDHHNLPESSLGLPHAVSVVHPRLPGSTYPFGELCGAGVAYKLAWRLATLACGVPKVAPAIRSVLLDVLSFAALGAVADVVPLLDENRVIVRHGLTKLRHSANEGVQALIEASGLAGEKVEEFDIGFKLGPRLNACGRLGHAREAVELFTTATGERAASIARELTALNEERRAVQDRIHREALELAEAKGMTGADVRAIVLAHDDWHPGVVGIACSKLVEKFHRPVILMGRSEGMCHGSGRSIDGFDLHEAIASCAPLLGHFGGHAMAAGLHVSDNNLSAFTERFCAFANQRIRKEDLCAKIRYDCEAKITEINRASIEELERLAPFGRENPPVSIVIRDAVIAQRATMMGSSGKHIQLRIGSGGTSPSLRLVGWDWAEHIEQLPKDRPIDVVLKPKISKWQGNVSVEAEIEDIRPR